MGWSEVHVKRRGGKEEDEEEEEGIRMGGTPQGWGKCLLLVINV